MGNQREILAGAVLDLHQQAGDATIPEGRAPMVLTLQAEESIESAANMLRAGLPPENVLRCLYLLAFMAGVVRS